MSPENDALPVGNSFDQTADKGSVAAEAANMPPSPASVGGQLRAAREKAGMSIGDVARLLKLGPNQVHAMEADDWSSLPGKTIIRGFVRNYARLLGLDSARLMAGLDALVLPQPPELKMSAGTPVKFSQDTATDHRDTIRYISGFLILILALLAYLLVPQELWQSTLATIRNAAQSHKVVTEAGKPADAEILEPAPVVLPLEPSAFAPAEMVNALPNPLNPQTPTEALVPSVSQTLPLTDLSATAATMAVPLPETDIEAPALAAVDHSLEFHFKQAAWVEVRDHSGKSIFSQLNQAGSQRVIVGEPPYSIIVGNAGQVELRYQGKVIDLTKRSKDDVARLTLE